MSPIASQPPVLVEDVAAARRGLRAQVAHLEEDLAGLRTSAWPRLDLAMPAPAGGAARVLSLADLEALRDELDVSVRTARRALSERTEVEEGNRRLIEEMLLDPEAHAWVRVSHADIGEPGCRHWHARPRFGPLGRFAKWWRVRISSGCP